MNKKRVTTTFTRGTLGNEDVDHLVEMINVDNNKPHHQSATNPKKAAKKARQKQRKEDEKRQQEEEERLRLLEIEMQRRKLAEEQLQKSMRELNISNHKSKGRRVTKAEQNQNKNIKLGNSASTGKNGNTGQKTYASKGVSCSLIGSSGFSTPWRTYMGWDSMDSVKENKSTDYFTPSGMPVPRIGQMHINHVDQAVGVDILPHGFISSPVIYKEEKIGKVRLNPSKSDKNVTVVSESETRTQKKKKRRKNKKEGSADSGSTNCINMSENENIVRIKRLNNILTRAVNSPTLNISEEGAKSLSSVTAVTDSQLSTTDSNTTSSKPEMVTIRRHPSISETTVTISIKNREGEEDILYTLLNGQVVRSQVDAVGASNGIEEQMIGTDEKKKSRRKRNRKKGTKNELESATSSCKENGPPPCVRDFVTCTPILNPPQEASVMTPSLEDFVPESNFPVTYTRIQQSNRVSDDQYYENEMEIDLSKLRLPPGITITKVNQPTLSLGNHNKGISFSPMTTGEKQGNMVRICNTGILGPNAIVSHNSEAQSNYSPVFIDPGERNEPGQDTEVSNSVSISHHSAACNCNTRNVANQCHVQEDVFYGAGATSFKPWFQQNPEGTLQSNRNSACNPTSASTGVEGEPPTSLLGHHFTRNPFQVTSSSSIQQNTPAEVRKMKMASFSHGHGLSEKSFKRKQPRPMYTATKTDFNSSGNNLTGLGLSSDSDGTSTNSSEGNSSYQAYALSLQHSLSQSQGRNPSASISTNFLGNNPANGNFTFGSSYSKFSQAPPQVFCSDETR